MSGTTDLAKVGSAGSDLVATSLSVGADGLEVSRTSDITSSPPVPTLTRTLNTRDAANRVTRATLSTGPSTTFLSQYLYDSAGRVQRQWGPDSGAGAGYLATAATTNAYTYHATTGQKTGESIKLQAVGTAGAITASYTYTGAGRLSTATVNGVADSTVFDAAGNLTSFTGTTLTYQENRLAT
ncbi:MAG: hypothetical protein KKA32_14845, partial [Actinobacteria bacterium]|nr:hypothetical protein [Actinomycetota bacterium]